MPGNYVRVETVLDKLDVDSLKSGIDRHITNMEVLQLAVYFALRYNLHFNAYVDEIEQSKVK